MVLLTAGNLAVTQAVVSQINEQIADGADDDSHTMLSVSTMFQAARLVGEAVREVRRTDGDALETNSENFAASFILGGQIGPETPRLFQVYAAGNFIEATRDTPYFQIGEHKYGKPILDRVAVGDMRLGEAAKLILLSFDSTLRSNLSVGMPIDMLLYRKDTLEVTDRRRIEEDDAYFRGLSSGWSDALCEAFGKIEAMPD